MHPKFKERVTSVLAWTEAASEEDQLAGGGGPPHDGGMEARVAKLEATVEYIQRDIAEIKIDLKSMDQALRQFGGDVNVEFRSIRSESKDEFKTVRAEARADFIKLFSALIVATLGLAGLMAKGFGWI